MKTLILLVLTVISLTGCITMLRGTPHEFCMDNAKRYANYNECYQEETSYRQNIREAMRHIGYPYR